MATDSILVFFIGVQKVGYIAEFFCSVLQSFDLLSKLRLLRLFFAENLVDILHEYPSSGHFKELAVLGSMN